MIHLDLDPNEASGLLAIDNQELLDAHEWDFGFWVVMDEGPVEDCVAAVGHRRGTPVDDGWEIDRLHAKPVGFTGVTEDSEALARADGCVWVFGSHFGKKAGPLEPRRSFVARFTEADVAHVSEEQTRIEVSRQTFVLHRLVNDALAALTLVPRGPNAAAAFIDATRDRGAKRKKKWLPLLRAGDYPLNVEGAAFRPDGTLLLGLRYPTTADGHPVIVDLEGAEKLFDGGQPRVRGLWVVEAVGRDGGMAGFRDLTVVPAGAAGGTDELHLVTGNIDARDKGSVLLEDHPEGAATVNTHWSCPLPAQPDGDAVFVGRLAPARVREFPTFPRIEGIAARDDGTFFYVSDEDDGVHVRHTDTPLLTAAAGGGNPA